MIDLMEEVELVLTFRELEYLSLAALGFSNHFIAETLCVTFSTVKKTFEGVYLKLNARNRANAVCIAFLHNLINVESLTDIVKRYNLEYVEDG